MTDRAPPPLPNYTDVQRYVMAAACMETGLLPALGEPRAAESLAESLALDLRATMVLLRALAEAGLAEQTGDAWTLTAEGRTFVERGAGMPFPHQLHLLASWARLPEVTRTGRPVPRGTGEEHVARFMGAMAARAPEHVARVADRLAAIAPGGRLLDLGGGPGLFARAMIARGWKATILDRPEVIAHVRGAYGLGDVAGLTLVPGDFLETLAPGDFEVVLCANITHIFTPETNAALLARVAAAYPSLKAIAVLDFVVGVSPAAALFAVNMLVNTDAGDTYDLAAYRSWLSAAGFGAVEVIDTGGPSRHQLLIARRG
jgi:hypothetical protein